MRATDLIPIGQLAERVGISVSAIRFYESKGMIRSVRNAGGHRRFLRADVRRLSFILITQKLGFSISEISEQLAKLPQGRNPTKRDWEKISRSIRTKLNERVAALEALRDRLDGCIGCGCLSLKTCAIYNPLDAAHEKGQGPRYLMGDTVRWQDK